MILLFAIIPLNYLLNTNEPCPSHLPLCFPINNYLHFTKILLANHAKQTNSGPRYYRNSIIGLQLICFFFLPHECLAFNCVNNRVIFNVVVVCSRASENCAALKLFQTIGTWIFINMHHDHVQYYRK